MKPIPFYRYDPSQRIQCGRCVEACQNVEVNETLSINWEDPNPRVLWDGGSTIGKSSCVSCGHCVTVCPCNALMEKSMLGQAGFFTSLRKSTLSGMIDVVNGVEPETGYGSILQVSEVEAAMREHRSARPRRFAPIAGSAASRCNCRAQPPTATLQIIRTCSTIYKTHRLPRGAASFKSLYLKRPSRAPRFDYLS